MRNESDRLATLVQHPTGPAMNAIVRAVARFYGVEVAKLRSPVRMMYVASQRAVAMYLCREVTQESYNAIGRYFSRDHSTIMAACLKVTEWLKTNKGLAGSIATIRASLEPVDNNANERCPTCQRPVDNLLTRDSIAAHLNTNQRLDELQRQIDELRGQA